ncbi:hypothetical protein D5086_008087 [Populus alba]|uniref:Uncharacterized protein n=1 Tax=Populus alba TaxID=43335 RepID=A0ACC4CEM9_POPAL
MMELLLLGCTGVVVFLHGANFFFHILSHHFASRSLRMGFVKKQFLAFYEMHLLGIKCNEFAFPSVLKACTVTKDLVLGKQVHGIVVVTGFDSDEFVANSLVILYAKCRGFGDARRLFDAIPDRSVVSWNALFSCYVHSDMHGEAVSLFHDMVLSGIRPNEFSLSTNALVDMYAKVGILEDASSVFDEIAKPDIVSWNAIIAGHSQNEEDEEAASLFPLMHTEGIGFNQTTLSTVLKSIAALQANYMCRQIHALSLKSGFEFDNYVVNSLVDTYGKCGHVEDATRVFEESPIVDLVLFTSLVTTYAQDGQGEEALRLYLEMQDRGIKPDSFAPMFFLQNIYASVGMWDKVARVRRLMKDGKVKKEPGMSWLEVKDKTQQGPLAQNQMPTAKQTKKKLEVILLSYFWTK